jgi:hypothetical protein
MPDTRITHLLRGTLHVNIYCLFITYVLHFDGSAGKQFVLDLKTVAMVDGKGVWDERWNPATGHHDNPELLTAEQIKYRKHEAQYAQTGHSFVAFVCSCFGALGPSAIRYLWVLAMLELRQHEALRHIQGLDPLDDSERAQFRATDILPGRQTVLYTRLWGNTVKPQRYVLVYWYVLV